MASLYFISQKLAALSLCVCVVLPGSKKEQKREKVSRRSKKQSVGRRGGKRGGGGEGGESLLTDREATSDQLRSQMMMF